MNDPLVSPPPPVESIPPPEIPDELAVRRAQLLAELDDVERAIAESGATPPAAGTDAEATGGTPAPGSAPEPGDVEAARAAAPAAPEPPVPPEAPEDASGDDEAAEEATEGEAAPEPGAPAHPSDVTAARSAPPAPVNLTTN